MGIQIREIGAGGGMCLPFIHRTELRTAVTGNQRLPVPFLLMMDPSVAQSRDGFLGAADRAGLRPVLCAGGCRFFPAVLAGRGNGPRFFGTAAGADAFLFAGSAAGCRLSLLPAAPAVDVRRFRGWLGRRRSCGFWFRGSWSVRFRLSRLWSRGFWLCRLYRRRLFGFRWGFAWL